jgi:hypothetical protein
MARSGEGVGVRAVSGGIAGSDSTYPGVDGGGMSVLDKARGPGGRASRI